MNDQTLVSAVKAALQQTGYRRLGQIRVSASQGRVVLTGEIEWDYQKRTALYAAQAVPGVVGITDNIVLRFLPPPFSSSYFQSLARPTQPAQSSSR